MNPFIRSFSELMAITQYRDQANNKQTNKDTKTFREVKKEAKQYSVAGNLTLVKIFLTG